MWQFALDSILYSLMVLHFFGRWLLLAKYAMSKYVTGNNRLWKAILIANIFLLSFNGDATVRADGNIGNVLHHSSEYIIFSTLFL